MPKELSGVIESRLTLAEKEQKLKDLLAERAFLQLEQTVARAKWGDAVEKLNKVALEYAKLRTELYNEAAFEFGSRFPS